jgi:hypothetical protein
MSAGEAGASNSQPPVFSATGLVAWSVSAAIGLATVHAGGGVATLSVPVTLSVALLGYWLPTALAARRP